MNYTIGMEVDTHLREAAGAVLAAEAKVGWYRHMAIDWDWFEPKAPVGGVHTYVYPEDVLTAPEYEPWRVNNQAYREALDAGIAWATGKGMKVMLCIRNPPGWATCSGISGCGRVKESCYQAFAEFVDYIVGRYKVAPYSVAHYELFNEPDATETGRLDLVGGWLHPVDYIKMQMVVYPYVKARHESIYILNGGLWMEDTNDPAKRTASWTYKWMKTGYTVNGVTHRGTDYLDMIAYHAYDLYDEGAGVWRYGTESVPSMYLKRFNLLKQWYVHKGMVAGPSVEGYSYTKPIAMNEGAVGTGNHNGGTSLYWQAFRRAQAYFIAYMLADMRPGEMYGNRPEMYNWWTFVDLGRDATKPPDGVIETYDLTQALGWMAHGPEVYHAHEHLAVLQFGSPFVEGLTKMTTLRGAVSIIKLTNDITGADRWLVWNTNGAASADIAWDVPANAAGGTHIYDVWGNKIETLPPGAIGSITLEHPYKVIWVDRPVEA